jgi:predicted dehydrogenase
MQKRNDGKSGSLSRRDFLKGGTLAGVALGFPTIVPASVFGANAPSNRIVMGVIGGGEMGKGDMSGLAAQPGVHYVAVCDVHGQHRERIKRMLDQRYENSDCAMYGDFREMLARGDLDAVNIAVPDHWHAIPAIAAAKAGLHIYGEKPFARSIREGRAMVNAIQQNGIVWQTGSQQRSAANFRHACELVRNGRLGKVRRVEVGLPRGGQGGVKPPAPVPADLDWDFWLGPAPWRPYSEFGLKNGPHWHWRWIRDFSGGQLTDWAGHHIDIAHWGLGLERTGPETIEGSATYPTDGVSDTPMKYRFTCKYANGVEIVVADNEQFPRGGTWFGGVTWYGENGWLYVNRGMLDSSPKSIMHEVIGAGEIRLYRSDNHHANFIECVRSRQPTVAPPEVGHRSISVALLGEIAMLTGRKIRWNPQTEEIIGDPGAAAMLGRTYREPWTLG